MKTATRSPGSVVAVWDELQRITNLNKRAEDPPTTHPTGDTPDTNSEPTIGAHGKEVEAAVTASVPNPVDTAPVNTEGSAPPLGQNPTDSATSPAEPAKKPEEPPTTSAMTDKGAAWTLSHAKTASEQLLAQIAAAATPAEPVKTAGKDPSTMNTTPSAAAGAAAAAATIDVATQHQKLAVEFEKQAIISARRVCAYLKALPAAALNKAAEGEPPNVEASAEATGGAGAAAGAEGAGIPMEEAAAILQELIQSLGPEQFMMLVQELLGGGGAGGPSGAGGPAGADPAMTGGAPMGMTASASAGATKKTISTDELKKLANGLIEKAASKKPLTA